MKYTFTIGDHVFKTKKAVIEYVQQNIHGRYADHVDLSAEHLRFMVGLLRYHAYSDQKIGCGVKRMWIQPNELYPTRGFWLERVDGSQTDFSFYQCVNPSSPLRDFKSACRMAIVPTIQSFRNEFFEGDPLRRCPINGDIVTLHNSHVDHQAPHTFESIVTEFIAVNKIDVASAPLTTHGDGTEGCSFSSEKFKQEWIQFHNERAMLRVISPKANLTLNRGLQAA